MDRLHIAEHEACRPRGLLIKAYIARGIDIIDLLDEEGVDCIENMSEERCNEILSTK